VVRRTIWALDRDQPVAGIATMDELLDRAMGRRRFQLVLFSLFGGVAAVLALVGVYGVLGYVAGQMSSEIGLRMALGATRGGIVWSVLRIGLVTTGAGVVAGLVLALWSGRLLEGFLFGVEANDPLVLSAVGVLLVLAATAACLGPARRAAATDPLTALRAR
jgi:putative ABC transport system permease protein